MSDKNPEEIRKLIDKMQSGLVDLFDQLHELKRRLNIAEQNSDDRSDMPVVPIFSEVSKLADDEENKNDRVEAKHSTTPEPTDDSATSIPNTRIARVLDPILHELRTGESPAEVIAEYLQAAKEYLLPDGNSHDKVAHDIDVVLKFLRARGNKTIRPEERDSILKRIGTWKIHLARSET